MSDVRLLQPLQAAGNNLVPAAGLGLAFETRSLLVYRDSERQMSAKADPKPAQKHMEECFGQRMES